jgi:hypothetical protein
VCVCVFFVDFLDGASLVIDQTKKDLPLMGNIFVENFVFQTVENW